MSFAQPIIGKEVKYYFAYFVRKGGLPSPLHGHCSKSFCSKLPKDCVFCHKNLKIVLLPKNTDLFSQKVAELGGTPLFGQFFGKKGVTDLGGTPPPFWTKSAK